VQHKLVTVFLANLAISALALALHNPHRAQQANSVKKVPVHQLYFAPLAHTVPLMHKWHLIANGVLLRVQVLKLHAQIQTLAIMFQIKAKALKLNAL